VAYTVTARSGPEVRRWRLEQLGPALDRLREVVDELAGRPAADRVTPPLMRTFEPGDRVVARVELSGPRRMRGGIDLRGDGAIDAFTGRIRRRQVEPQAGESSCDALARVLSERR
jgi:hypothetical protein